MVNRRACILGALVADAATMGFHWLYSQEKIQSLASVSPEFYTPTEEDYKGLGYFAHANKSVGEFSHYGEQSLVMLTALDNNNGEYDKQVYQDAFRDHFGYGGGHVGYIDRPTRQTLDNIYRGESDRLHAANNIAFDGKNRKGLLIKVLAAAKLHQGDRLRSHVEAIADRELNSEESKRYVLTLIDAISANDGYPGADDDQLPAISQLPALLARHYDSDQLHAYSESSIKVTNNNSRAIDFGKVATHLLKNLLEGHSVNQSIENAVESGSEKTQTYLNTGLSSDSDLLGLTKEFGMNCDVGSGMVSVLANLRASTSYADAIRANIYAGGDNCGRSTLLGAAAGIHYGVGGEHGIPVEWIEKVSQSKTILEQIDLVLKQKV
ncbi:MAG: ADP-ribosylglycohydrolase [Flavobacterium sp.]|jgi:ADP-ribosylglycohydrolase